MAQGTIEVALEITNSGQRAGSEVVQLYVRDNIASMVRPVQELKAFQRVMLEPGETARLTFFLPTDMLNFTSREGERIVEPGEFELQVGASSGDIRQRTVVTLTGETRQLPQQWRILSHCEVARGR